MKPWIPRLVLAVALAVLIPACFYDTVAGIKTDPKSGEVTADVAHSPAAATIHTIETVTDATPVGPIVRLVGEGLLALFGVAAEVRRRDWKKAAVATAQGVQNVVSHLDSVNGTQIVGTGGLPEIADMMKAAIDKEHDSHAVSQAVQNLLTPVT